MRRCALLITIVALASLGLAVPVLAAAPTADTYAGRTTIASLPFSETTDTTEATTDTDDAEAIAPCAPVPTDASVWYEYTPTTAGPFTVTTYDSDYSTGIVVLTGSPGTFSFVTCDAGSVYVSPAAGETYTIMVFDYQGDGGGNGGTLTITVADVPPPPVLDVTIASTGSFNARTGAATIRGTLSCTGGEAEGKNFIDIQVGQTVGRVRFSGQGFTTFACDGSVQTWAAEVVSSSGKFAGGKASVTLFAVACAGGGCAEVQATASVTLKK